MKNLLKIIVLLFILPSTSFAKRITCANLDYSAKAEISQVYFGVILLRRLHNVEIEQESVFSSVVGRIDNSESFEENGYEIDMFSGGITVSNSSDVYELACSAPSEYQPGTPEHLDHVNNWNYLFN